MTDIPDGPDAPNRTGPTPQRRQVVTGGLAAAVLSASAPAKAANPSPVVETADGKVQGFQSAGVCHFRGLPYGAPTGGVGRFMPPRKPAAWTGVRELVDYAPIAPQTPTGAPPGKGALAMIHVAPEAGESEDCLYLNVWTPRPDGARRPVVVWLHGGAYAIGSGSMEVYDGAHLARQGDVVVVNVNHRLNVFGYVHLADLGGPDFAGSGLVGMLDLVQALQWVRDNIDRFGGDPSRVTVFGESGGAGKVSTLMAMPAARGLFHRAVLNSGPSIFLPERDEADRTARAFMASLSLRPDQVRELQAMPTQQLTDAAFRFMMASPDNLMSFAPVMDGDLLPLQPGYPGAPAFSRDVPVLLGSNLTESAFMWMGDPTVFSLDEAGLRGRLGRSLGSVDVDKALAVYRRVYPAATPSELFLLINTDKSMRKNTLRMADARVSAGAAATYVYHFRFPTPYMGGRLKTPHFMDVPLIFGTYGLPGVSEFVGAGPELDRMARTMSDAWIAFARAGSPRTAALADWSPYTLPRRETMILNRVSRLENDPDAATRRFWESLDYQII